MGKKLKKPPCPPHYWLINEKNVGRCKKCNEVRDFGKEMKRKLKRPYIKGINPRYTPKQKEY